MKHMEELQLREAKQKHETPEKKNLNKKYLIFQYMCVCVCVTSIVQNNPPKHQGSRMPKQDIIKY